MHVGRRPPKPPRWRRHRPRVAPVAKFYFLGVVSASNDYVALDRTKGGQSHLCNDETGVRMPVTVF